MNYKKLDHTTVIDEAGNKYQLLKETAGNWNYYTNAEKTAVYYVANNSGCLSGYFGSMKYFKKMEANL